MAWASVRRGHAVARAWGLMASAGLCVGLGAVALIATDAYVDLPLLRNRTTVLHLLPVLAATAAGFPLVDRTPDLTLVSSRHPAVLPIWRLAGTAAAMLPTVAGLVAAGWTVAGASVALGFVGVAALAAGVLRLWYWAPMLVAVVLWAHLRPPYLAVAAGWGWAGASLLMLVVGGAACAATQAHRVRRATQTRRTSR